MNLEEFAENLKNEIDAFIKAQEQSAEKLKKEIDELSRLGRMPLRNHQNSMNSLLFE